MYTNIYGLTEWQLRKLAPSIFASQPHESCSSQFLYIPTYEVVEMLASAGVFPVSAHQSSSRTPGKEAFTKHLIRFRPSEFLGSTASEVQEYVLLNSHDRTSAYKLFLGVFRLVCGNGLIVGDVCASITIPHRGNVLSSVLAGTYELLGQSNGVASSIQVMKDTYLLPDQQLKFAEAAMTLRFSNPADVVFEPEDLLTRRIPEDMGESVWLTFQAVQRNAVSGGPVRIDTEGKKHTIRPITNIPDSVRLNRALWNLAESTVRGK